MEEMAKGEEDELITLLMFEVLYSSLLFSVLFSPFSPPLGPVCTRSKTKASRPPPPHRTQNKGMYMKASQLVFF